MGKRLALKFRIAGIVFILEAIMIAVVLGVTTHTQLTVNRAELNSKEDVIVNIVVNHSRAALLNHDYEPLQSQIDQLAADPHIVDIEVANRKKTIVAASILAHIGQKLEPRGDDKFMFWRTVNIDNKNGSLGTVAIQFSHLGLLNSERKAVERGWHTAAIGMLIIAAISVIVGSFLTRRLAALSEAASRIANGDLNARAKIKGNDEIAIVGQAFDQMAESVSRMFEELHTKRDELQSAQNELEQRVAERTAELAVARDDALKANRAKGTFLANISHELRTPLNAIIGYTELLLEETVSTHESSAEDLKKVLCAANHLLSLINNVLDLAKIDAGKMDVNLENFFIRDVILEAAQTIQPMMIKHKNQFQLSCPENLDSLFSDRIKVYQCILNILGNAAKYTDNGKIDCRVTRITEDKRNWIVIIVEDTGIGIPEDKIKFLFEEFSQLDSSSRHQTGTGLGLALTRQMSQLLGGSISAHSQTGRGSTFILRLPERLPVTRALAEESKETLIDTAV